LKKTKLLNGQKIFCIKPTEAQILHEHINGYIDNFIEINDNDTIIDVGANIGIFGLELSSKYPNIKIFSFEPILDIFNILKENAKISKNKNFNFYNYGISNKNETINFTYFPNAPALSSSNDEIWGSKKDLIEAFNGNLKNAPNNWWWKKLIPKFTYPYIINYLTKNKKEVSCKLKPLSKVIDSLLIKKINLLKIDCEGNEHKVIEGINEKNWKIIEQLIIEINDIDGRLNYIKNKLEKLGYKIKILKEPSLKRTNLYNLFAKK
tara:strand:+ start:30386 stop:31177 length:792 start_codon:yes stop_codon:yes gene_type:complete